MSDTAVRMLSWGARVLYVGPPLKLSPHRNVVGVLCICLEGSMEVQVGEALRDGRGVVCRSAYIRPGTRHLMLFEAERIACLYVDRESDDPARIESEMTFSHDGLLVEHERRDEIVRTLLDFVGDRIERGRRRETVAAAYGLAQSGEGADPRISAAIRSIFENPGAPHRAVSLARAAGLSESRFRHAFREAAGVPLKRYRIWARVGAAMAAIRAGANLTQAAHDAGFSSSAHFSSAYRAMFGTTPSAFVATALGRSIGPRSPNGSTSPR